MDLTVLWYLLATVVVLLGLFGVIVPILPGIPVMFAGLWLAAWADGFEHVGLWPLVILAALTVISVVVDLVASLLGARRVGASTRGLVGATLGALAGLAFGLVGILLGPFLGAVIGELAHGHRLEQASRVGIGTWIGMIVGTAVKAAIAFSMLGLFALAWWW